MGTITGSVGRKGQNSPEDVKIIQQLLARHRNWLGGMQPPAATGNWDAQSDRTLLIFQREAAALANPDGIVIPNGYTITALEKSAIHGPSHRVFKNFCWLTGSPIISETNYKSAATTLGCEVAAIKAVADTEVKGRPWDIMGRPLILFERHKFAEHTNNRFNRSHPDISNTASRGYGTPDGQYQRLRRAAMLDEAAALKSASWGMFQILGQYHGAAGYPTVATFVDGMMGDVSVHLKAFVGFIQATRGLHRALKDKDWPTFARYYNGKNYADNDYDGKMSRAYSRFATPITPKRTAPAQ